MDTLEHEQQSLYQISLQQQSAQFELGDYLETNTEPSE